MFLPNEKGYEWGCMLIEAPKELESPKVEDFGYVLKDLNADGYASTGQGVLAQNMFAYCQNNPVMYVDPTGECTIVDNRFVIKCKYSQAAGKAEKEHFCDPTNLCQDCADRIYYSNNCYEQIAGLQQAGYKLTFYEYGEPIWPMPNNTTQTTYAGHSGTDFPAPEGTPIYSVLTGTVVAVDTTVSYNTYDLNLRSWGIHVIVEVSPGVRYIYAHLSQANVVVGQKVYQWDIIGKCGNTGYSTGPHLHFQVQVNGKTVSPYDYLPK